MLGVLIIFNERSVEPEHKFIVSRCLFISQPGRVMFPLLAESIWWMPCYGLLGALLSLPWGLGLIRRSGSRPAAYINIAMTLAALIHGTLILTQVWHQPAQKLVIPWLDAADFHLSLTLDVSAVSTTGAVLITGMSLVAQIYALGYMEKDWALARFYGLMGVFEAAMSGIAMSDSLFLSYALLEMLTLSTYLLVGFWYAQPLVITAARDAFLTKRVGDLILLMGVIALSMLSGSLSFSDLGQWAQTANLAPLTAALLGLALIAGPTGKCAQFPLHLWLDEAMEGPNPASILRNSVVVACGAFVLIKLQPVVTLSPVAVATLLTLGAVTAVGASLVSMAQIDIKRALAHSTSAYMGLVFIAVGIQESDVALELLFVHGIAKALLFMSSGAVILTTTSQDLTEMGGLGSRMPATHTAFLIGAATLIACPPLAGFWVMLQLAETYWIEQPWLVGILLLVNTLTVLNLARVFRLVFAGDPQPKTRRAPEVAWPMALPLVSLTIFALLLPWLLYQVGLVPGWAYLFAPIGEDPLQKLILLAVIPSLLVSSTLVGLVIGGNMNLSRTWARSIQTPVKFLQDLLSYDFYVDRLYQVTVVALFNQGARLLDWIDRYIVDGLVNFFSLASVFGGETLKYTTSGRSQLYLLTILLGLVLVSLLMIFRFQLI